MIDIRTIEIVTPDLQRQSLIESNYKLKGVTIMLMTMLVITVTIYSINYINQEQNKEK